ncbi:MAG: fumarylacetoacetase [Jatrophihabitans sp.]|nr:fumarylacetoacetase [Jatrophihabitans sp.]
MSFGIDNLPYGSVIGADGRRFAAARFGADVLDLSHLDPDLFAGGTLDAFLAGGRPIWTRVRADVVDALTADRYPLTPLADVTPVLAFTVADYVDFYASEHHATNAGRIFRPDGAALTPNWKHQPLGYHGRSGSVVVSGTDVPRPRGQFLDGDAVTFGPTRRLDFEAEVAFVVGRPGSRIAVADADDHIFGVCLLNDWSARDMQGFETPPLGPFLGKSFATSIGAWITPLDALAGVRTAPRQDPLPLPHLRETDPAHGLRLDLEVRINGQVVSRPPFGAMYWTYAQMLAHLTSNGSAVRAGDLFASGTVSGPDRGHRGCLLELTWNGTEPLDRGDGATGTWLEDGDEVTIAATAGAVTLAEVRGRVLPSVSADP